MAVIGAGYWGTKLVREYSLLSKAVDGVSLNAVADTSSHQLNELRAQIDNDSLGFYNDYREVLRDREIDAVHIALPNDLHYEVARKALESGKHVLLEKPMTTSSREAKELATLSKKNHLVLQVGHIFRFNNALRKVRGIIGNNTLGRVFYANLTWSTYTAPPKDRDIVFDLAPHPIDILNYLLDQWPISVNAVGSSYLRKEAGKEEAAFIHLKFLNNIIANVYVSWIHHGSKERTVQLVGEEASLKCDALNQTVTVCTSQAKTEKTEIAANNTIRDMQLHFLDTIRGGGSQLNGSSTGVNTVKVLEAVCRSMKTESFVNVFVGR